MGLSTWDFTMGGPLFSSIWFVSPQILLKILYEHGEKRVLQLVSLFLTRHLTLYSFLLRFSWRSYTSTRRSGTFLRACCSRRSTTWTTPSNTPTPGSSSNHTCSESSRRSSSRFFVTGMAFAAFLVSIVQALIHSVVHLFILSFIHSFIHSVVHSFILSFIHSFCRSFILSFIHSFCRSFIHSVVHSFILLFILSAFQVCLSSGLCLCLSSLSTFVIHFFHSLLPSPVRRMRSCSRQIPTNTFAWSSTFLKSSYLRRPQLKRCCTPPLSRERYSNVLKK